MSYLTKIQSGYAQIFTDENRLIGYLVREKGVWNLMAPVQPTVTRNGNQRVVTFRKKVPGFSAPTRKGLVDMIDQAPPGATSLISAVTPVYTK